MEYLKSESRHILTLTHHDLQSSQVLHQWNVAVLYEGTSWLSDMIKFKATRVVPGERVFKVNLKIPHASSLQLITMNVTENDLLIDLVLRRGRKTRAVAMGDFE